MFSLLGINLVLIALYTFMGHSYRDFITVAFFKSIHILMIVNAKRIYYFFPVGDSIPHPAVSQTSLVHTVASSRVLRCIMHPLPNSN